MILGAAVQVAAVTRIDTMRLIIALKECAVGHISNLTRVRLRSGYVSRHQCLLLTTTRRLLAQMVFDETKWTMFIENLLLLDNLDNQNTTSRETSTASPWTRHLLTHTLPQAAY